MLGLKHETSESEGKERVGTEPPDNPERCECLATIYDSTDLKMSTHSNS